MSFVKHHVVIAFIVGFMVSWVIHERTKPISRRNPFSITIEPGHEFRIVRPSLSGNDWKLKPFAVHRDERKILFDEPPADASQIWLITYNGVIVSCRSEQTPSQQP